jgi:hypothetical protein
MSTKWGRLSGGQSAGTSVSARSHTGRKQDLQWSPLALLETGEAIRLAVSEWHEMLSNRSAGSGIGYISRVAMLNDRSVVIRPGDGSELGVVLFVGKLVRKTQEVLARDMLDAPMPPRPRAWACASKTGDVIRLVCLPFEGDEPRIVVLFDT